MSFNNYETNDEAAIQKITKQILKEKNESNQIKLLLKGNSWGRLKGVQIPVASAILTVIYPEKYCIIDFRAWRALMWWKNASSDGNFIIDSYGKYCEYLDNLGKYSRL